MTVVISQTVGSCYHCPHVSNNQRDHDDAFTSAPLDTYWYCTHKDRKGTKHIDDHRVLDKNCPEISKVCEDKKKADMPQNPRPECKHCEDVHDGVFGSFASPCPFHNEDGSAKPDKMIDITVTYGDIYLQKRISEQSLARANDKQSLVGGEVMKMYETLKLIRKVKDAKS